MSAHETECAACPELAELERFVQHELDPALLAALETHVSSCGLCRGRIDDVKRNLAYEGPMRQLWHRLDAGGADADPFGPAALPQTIGGYRIRRRIGEGGMGSVFEAEQESPRRLVALKVIRPGRVSPMMLRRFRHEMQVLGRLQHPGIAQIYEGGTEQAPDGPRPYFVMELVDGQPLVHFARTRSLDPRQRLELMAMVCDAVAHAHVRGVIHRDLKPGNILVSDRAGLPQPKILDFGIARAVDPDLQLTTMQTDVGQLVGTIAYMSPEQVSGPSRELDVRSDVYALGVICYELLAERLPYDLAQRALPELVWQIGHDDPAPLSLVNRAYRGDVETIVAKALEKEPRRRYDSAAEMAADIRRYLRDEPIVARPASTSYQLRKFARRNKGLVAGVVTAFIVLLVGVLVSGLLAVHADQLRQRAEANARRAEDEAGRANAINQFLKDMLMAVHPDRAQGREPTVREVLEQATTLIDDGSMQDQPQVEASVRTTLGNVFAALGLYSAGEQQLLRALELRRALHPGDHEETTVVLRGLAAVHQSAGNFAVAEQNLIELLEMQRRLWKGDRLEIAQTMAALGLVWRAQNRLDEAHELFRQALSMQQRVDPEHPNHGFILQGLSNVLSSKGDHEQAQAAIEEALRIHRKVLGDSHPDVIASLNNLADVLSKRGRLKEAETLLRQVIAIRRKYYGSEHVTLSHSLRTLGNILGERGRLDEAEAVLRESLSIARHALGGESSEVASALNNLGIILNRKGDHQAALEVHQEALAIRRKVFGDEHATVANTLHNLAMGHFSLGDAAQAEALHREVLALRLRVLPPDHPRVASSMHNIAFVLLKRNENLDEAESLLRGAIRIFQKRLGDAHPSTAGSRNFLGACLVRMKRYPEAEEQLLAAFHALQSEEGTAGERRASTIRNLVILYEAWDKPDEAQTYRALLPPTPPGAAATTMPALPLAE